MKKAALILGASLALSACFPATKTEVQTAADAALPGSGTYAWMAAPDHFPAEDNARAQDQDAQMMLGEALERELAVKGYKEVAENQAEFIMHYHTGVVEYMDIQEKAGMVGAVPTVQCTRESCRNTYTRNKVDPLTGKLPKMEPRFEGSLILDIHRRSNNELVWRGVITGEVKLDNAPRRDRIQYAVSKLLTQLPSATKPQ
ncbi:MAG TPA: DUF4136 domain-containing protein [Pseudomonadales bacterium]|nr:DUF4136 domain-containing protein [Pseudomonadales bacterium]